MENASKALIIAGAILLSILLISLGIMVYNQAKGTVSQANLSEQEIATFNGKYTSYLGTNKNAATVSSLIQTAIASNQAETSSGSNRTVKFGTGTAKATPAATDCGVEAATVASKTIPSTQVYTIQAVYTNGLITGLYISPEAWK